MTLPTYLLPSPHHRFSGGKQKLLTKKDVNPQKYVYIIHSDQIKSNRNASDFLMRFIFPHTVHQKQSIRCICIIKFKGNSNIEMNF